MKIEDIELAKGRRIKSVQISSDALLRILTEDMFMEITDGIPRGAQVLGIGMAEHRKDTVILIVEHPSFPLCGLGEIPVGFIPTGKTYYGSELQVFKKFIEAQKGTHNAKSPT